MAWAAQKVRAIASLRSCQLHKNVPEPRCCANLLSRHLGLCHTLVNNYEPSSYMFFQYFVDIN